jgi:hypothetical protein
MLRRHLAPLKGSLLAGALLLTLAWQPAAALQLPGDPAVARLLAVEQAQADLTNVDRPAPLTTDH